jgi:hypothetical protein
MALIFKRFSHIGELHVSIVAQSIIIKSVPRTSGCWRTRSAWTTKGNLKSVRRAARFECKCEYGNERKGNVERTEK